MPMTLGNVSFFDDECPEDITPGSALAAGVDNLSDGYQSLQISGWQPKTMKVSGTLWRLGADGTPFQKYQRLEAMMRQHKPVTFTWRSATGDAQVGPMSVYIMDMDPAIKRYSRIVYAITLFRIRKGSIQAGVTVARTRSSRANAALSTMSSLAPNASPQLQSTVSSAMAARANVAPTVSGGGGGRST